MGNTQNIYRFLIADNDEEAALFFKVLLMNRQIQNISIENSGEAALKSIENKRIQFVITAWEMEPMSGAVLVQRILAMRQYKNMPILIYSRQMNEKEQTLLSELNLTNILPYPVNEDDASELLKQMIEAEEGLDQAEVRLRQAELMLADKQYDVARNELVPVTKSKAFQNKIHTFIGETHLAENNFEEAEKSFSIALDADAEYNPALHALAKVYTKTKRHDKAVETLTKLSSESPYNIDTLINLGITYVDMNEDDKAKEAFNKVKEMDPTNPQANDELGKLSFKEGDYKTAAELLANTQNGEELVRHFNNLAVGMAAKSEFSKAEKTYMAAQNLMVGKGPTHILQYNLGLAYKKHGKLKEAFEILTACCQSNPKFIKAYAALVRVVKEMETKKVNYNKILMKKLKQENHKIRKIS